jgi:hypothetical protein
VVPVALAAGVVALAPVVGVVALAVAQAVPVEWAASAVAADRFGLSISRTQRDLALENLAPRFMGPTRRGPRCQTHPAPGRRCAPRARSVA